MEVPTNLLEAVKMFSDLDYAREFVVALRWPNGVECPRTPCDSKDVAWMATRKMWRCRTCGRQFTVKIGTVFEDSPLGLDKWLPALWLLGSNKNGISSCELARALTITQKSAWFLLHRLRLAMASRTFEKLAGTVEIDETYSGGKQRGGLRPGPHHGRKSRGPGYKKSIVMGMLQRGGEVRAFAVPDVKRGTLLPKIVANVEPGSTIYTDELNTYKALRRSYAHDVVNHAIEYARGEVHTNGIESFWALLKRALKGTYIHVDKMHLDRYVAEQVYRFNTREDHDTSRFMRAVRETQGKRLTYRELIKRWEAPTT